MTAKVLFPLSAALLVSLVFTLFIGINHLPATAWTWAQIIMVSLFAGYVCQIEDRK